MNMQPNESKFKVSLNLPSISSFGMVSNSQNRLPSPVKSFISKQNLHEIRPHSPPNRNLTPIYTNQDSTTNPKKKVKKTVKMVSKKIVKKRVKRKIKKDFIPR